MTLYQDVIGSPFTMFRLWTILKSARKWQEVMEDKERKMAKRKTSLAGDETDDLEDEEGGGDESDAQGYRPLGKKRAKMVRTVSHSVSLSESSNVMAGSSKEMVELTKRKVAALELISQDNIMSRDLEGMGERARRFYDLLQDKILKKIEQDK